MIARDIAWTGGSREGNPGKVDARGIDALTFTRLTAAGIAAALGSMVLIGWGSDLTFLTRPALHATATNPLTALSFILTALALALGPRRRPAPARLLASLVIAASQRRTDSLTPLRAA